jgi:hypothetical protein
MNVDIRNIPIFWLTSDKTLNRHAPMEHTLDSIGCYNAIKIVGRICTPHTIGIAESHLEAISRKSPPFLVLEDDARLNPSYTENTIFDIEENTDSLYLGTSTFGRMFGNSPNNSCISITNKQYLKPINMLGMHAIIYLTRKYIDHTTNLLTNFIKSPKGGIDDRIAETMSFFNVSSLRNPMFYQDDGHSNDATLTLLTPIF